jgi:hypothetical protein
MIKTVETYDKNIKLFNLMMKTVVFRFLLAAATRHIAGDNPDAEILGIQNREQVCILLID